MKKVMGMWLLLVTGLMMHAQEGFHVSIIYKPERIEIVPHVFQFYGTIVQSKDKKSNGEEAYAISVNEGLVTDVQSALEKGKPQILFGPKIEKLVVKMIIDDYKQIRTDIENDLKEQISNEEELGEKAPLRARLKLEKANTKVYVKRLKTIIQRYKVRCIYVHGVGNEVMKGNSGDDE